MWALKQGQILQTGKCGTWNKDEVFTLVNVGPETRVNSADWIMWALKEGWILQTEKCGPWNKVELWRLKTVCPETRVKQWGSNHQIILNILLLFYKTFGSYYCMGIVTNAHYTIYICVHVYLRVFFCTKYLYILSVFGHRRDQSNAAHELSFLQLRRGGFLNRLLTFEKFLILLKGHGNEADFLGFLHKSVRHRSLTLHFEPFRFWLWIRGGIRNQKTTLYSPSRGVYVQDCL
jgi:hypothetical protein